MPVRRRIWAATFAVAAVVAGCNGDDPAPPSVPPRITTTPPVLTEPAPTTTSSNTTVPTPTSSGTTVAPTDPTSVPTSSVPVGGSVSTLVGTVPQPLDPADPNNNREPPSTPEEQAIIDAYIKGSDMLHAYYGVYPIEAQHPLLLEAPITEDYRRSLQVIDPADTRILDTSGGFTYRPYLSDFDPGDTAAVVLDCQLDASVWRDALTGEKVDAPNPQWANTGPEVASPVGVVTFMVKLNGVWLSDNSVDESRACL